MSLRIRNECGIDEELAILRAVDTAHKNRRISSKLRYQILQSLFPPLESEKAGVRDFRFSRAVQNRQASSLLRVVHLRSEVYGRSS